MNHIFKKIFNKTLGRIVVVSEHAKSVGKSDTTTGSTPIDNTTVENSSASPVFSLKPMVVAVAICLGALSSQNVMAEIVIDCGPALGSNEISGAAAGGSGAFTYLTGKVACYSNAKGASVSSDDANDSMAVTIYTDSLKVGSGGIDSKGFVNEAASSKEISFNNNKLTNIVAGTAATDATNLKQVQDLIAAGGGSGGGSTKYVKVNSSVTGAGTNENGDGATGKDAVAIGVNAKATGTYSSAVGYNNTASATYSSALGYKNIASENYSNAVGTNNTASGYSGSAVGVGNTASGGIGSSAVGMSNTASGGYSSALGASNTASENYSSAMGYKNIASGQNSSAVGYQNTALGNNSSAVGSGNNASVANSSTFGFSNTASGDAGSIAVGSYNTASGQWGVAVGSSNKASSLASSSFGVSNTASGVNSSAVGYQNTASADNSSVFGSKSTASHLGATALGNNSVTDRDNSISVGKAGAEKQITFVKAAIKDTDATNLKQVQDLIAAGGGGTPVANDNYAKDANSAALGSASGYAYDIEYDNATNPTKITKVGGIDVTATGKTLDTITAINGENVTPAQVAQFKKAAEQGGNIALMGVALGKGNITSSVNGAVALGSGNKVYANYGATAIGTGNTTTGSFASAIGLDNTASNERSNALGYNNTASGRDSAAFGSGNTASGGSSAAFGAYNTASADNSSAFGSESTAAFENSTAIGYQSETDRTNSISVGKAGAEKQITFVKAGTNGTDAVNFAQLNSLTNVLGGSFNNGSYTAPTYVIQGSNYNNVSSAFTAVNTKLTSLQSQIDGLPSSGTSGKSAYQIATDNGFTGTETQWLTSLKGDKGDTGAVGANGAKGDTGAAGAKGDTGVAGAAGAKGDTGAVGATGAKGDTGAVGANGAKGDTGAVGATGAKGNTGAVGATGAKGDTGAVGATGATGKSAYEIAKQNGFTGTETEWANSASNSYIQIQSNTPKLGPKAIATGTDAIAIGTDALAQGKQSISIGVGNQVKGNNSGAIGDPSYINADDSYAIGNNNTINGDGKTFVVGNNVNTAAKNAVVLGNDSASDRDNTVSVGAAGKERQIIHVAAGVQDTDAVNVKQMKDVNTKTLTDAKTYADAGDQVTLISAKGYTDSREVVMRQEYKTADAKVLSDSKAYTDTKVMDLENNFRDVSSRVDQTNQDVRKNRDIAAQGIAGITAMTNIPMPAEQGASTVGLGMGYYDSQSAIAVGASHYFDNGIAIKGAFSTGFNNGNTTAVGTGVSYSWK